ncbi:MAG: hypothetical protein Ta2D_04500 [Rickettsiales bacterium]|nr:MAG: hypothetical protein Ta2D_04500 [Rickettsiales bacterium]
MTDSVTGFFELKPNYKELEYLLQKYDPNTTEIGKRFLLLAGVMANDMENNPQFTDLKKDVLPQFKSLLEKYSVAYSEMLQKEREYDSKTDKYLIPTSSGFYYYTSHFAAAIMRDKNNFHGEEVINNFYDTNKKNDGSFTPQSLIAIRKQYPIDSEERRACDFIAANKYHADYLKGGQAFALAITRNYSSRQELAPSIPIVDKVKAQIIHYAKHSQLPAELQPQVFQSVMTPAEQPQPQQQAFKSVMKPQQQMTGQQQEVFDSVIKPAKQPQLPPPPQPKRQQPQSLDVNQLRKDLKDVNQLKNDIKNYFKDTHNQSIQIYADLYDDSEHPENTEKTTIKIIKMDHGFTFAYTPDNLAIPAGQDGCYEVTYPNLDTFFEKHNVLKVHQVPKMLNKSQLSFSKDGNLGDGGANLLVNKIRKLSKTKEDSVISFTADLFSIPNAKVEIGICGKFLDVNVFDNNGKTSQSFYSTDSLFLNSMKEFAAIRNVSFDKKTENLLEEAEQEYAVIKEQEKQAERQARRNKPENQKQIIQDVNGCGDDKLKEKFIGDILNKQMYGNVIITANYEGKEVKLELEHVFVEYRGIENQSDSSRFNYTVLSGKLPDHHNFLQNPDELFKNMNVSNIKIESISPMPKNLQSLAEVKQELQNQQQINQAIKNANGCGDKIKQIYIEDILKKGGNVEIVAKFSKMKNQDVKMKFKDITDFQRYYKDIKFFSLDIENYDVNNKQIKTNSFKIANMNHGLEKMNSEYGDISNIEIKSIWSIKPQELPKLEQAPQAPKTTEQSTRPPLIQKYLDMSKLSPVAQVLRQQLHTFYKDPTIQEVFEFTTKLPPISNTYIKVNNFWNEGNINYHFAIEDKDTGDKIINYHGNSLDDIFVLPGVAEIEKFQPDQTTITRMKKMLEYNKTKQEKQKAQGQTRRQPIEQQPKAQQTPQTQTPQTAQQPQAQDTQAQLKPQQTGQQTRQRPQVKLEALQVKLKQQSQVEIPQVKPQAIQPQVEAPQVKPQASQTDRQTRRQPIEQTRAQETRQQPAPQVKAPQVAPQVKQEPAPQTQVVQPKQQPQRQTAQQPKAIQDVNRCNEDTTKEKYIGDILEKGGEVVITANLDDGTKVKLNIETDKRFSKNHVRRFKYTFLDSKLKDSFCTGFRNGDEIFKRAKISNINIESVSLVKPQDLPTLAQIQQKQQERVLTK